MNKCLLPIMLCLIVIITAFAVPTFASSEPSIDKYTLSSEEDSNEDGWVDISIVGDISTPEYGAYNEWKDYLSDSKPYNESIASEDEKEREPLDNYQSYYYAVTAEQARELDRIAAKYKMTLHTTREDFASIDDLYQMLNTSAFLPASYVGSGYIYDDGSFNLECHQSEDSTWLTMLVSKKGSFSMASHGMSTSCDAWNYITTSGQSVEIYSASYSSCILTDTPGAFISLFIESGSQAEYDPDNDFLLDKDQFMANQRKLMEKYNIDEADVDLEQDWQTYYQGRIRAMEQSSLEPLTKDDLETLADTIDFGILSSRFSD